MLLRRHRETPAIETPTEVELEFPEDIDLRDFTVEQVIEYLDLASPEKRAALIEQEKAGKNRKTIVEYGE